jgi:hypothetical protein
MKKRLLDIYGLMGWKKAISEKDCDALPNKF